MKKILIIVGLVIMAAVIEGVVFYVTSRMPVQQEQQEQQVFTPDDPAEKDAGFEAILEAAERSREHRRFDAAEHYIRKALEQAKNENEMARAGHTMGELLLDMYRQSGNEGSLEAAASYLEAAYVSSAMPYAFEIGMTLLDVFEALGDEERLLDFIEGMLESTDRPEDIITLWGRKFDALFAEEGSWPVLYEALSKAEAMPLKSSEWAKLLTDTRLRMNERLLADELWLKAYAQSSDPYTLDTYRNDLLERVREPLNKLIESDSKSAQEDALLRLANATVSAGDYDEGEKLLHEYMQMDPSEEVTDALILLSRISRMKGQLTHAADLAESLIRRFDFDQHSREEILELVKLLEQHRLYDDALELLKSCLGGSDSINEYAPLIGRAAVIEEQVGHRANAHQYMEQLLDLEAGEMLEKTFRELVDLNMSESQYGGVEYWVNHFVQHVRPGSKAYSDALFSLFESIYWLDRPPLDQLFVGSAAIQTNPEDSRAASVELRMAHFIENIKLNDLAVSYYNRIGLLNFFQGDALNNSFNRNIGEQAMLGKARCFSRMESWVSADHLYREICNRTKSPLIKSQAAIEWAEMAWKFSQNAEAERRYDMVHPQMLSEAGKVRYSLGRSRLEGSKEFTDPVFMEETLDLIRQLPDRDRRQATIDFFNETFDVVQKENNERAMERLIDLAYQSEYADWLPIQQYVLRLYKGRFVIEEISGLGADLRDKEVLAGAAAGELAGSVERLEKLAVKVKKHKRKAQKDE